MPCGDLNIEGKIVLVTGGGSGINLAFVEAIAKLSPKGILIADIRFPRHDYSRITRLRSTTSIVTQECNVAKRKDLENLITVSQTQLGDVPDVYVAGAGVFEPNWSNWWDDTEEDDYEELRINVNHPLKLSRIAVRALLSQKKKGVILIVASTGGYSGLFTAPLYCASKHAIVGFVRSMPPMDEYEGIKVVAIAPGLVQTPLWTSRPELMIQWGYDPARAIMPEEVARRMVELITDGQYGGGACMEVTNVGIRVLGEWNIAPSAYVSGNIDPEVTAKRHLGARALMKKEKGEEWSAAGYT